jgi:PQQ-dependent catabolism-associated CXXCW motif protein
MEPADYWSGNMEGAVPATLRGATVLPTASAANAWISARHPILLDVGPVAKKPPAMAPGMPWLPVHRDLPGSHFLPGAGRAVLTPDRRAAFLRAVAARVPPTRPVLVYCHQNCWASWNAARALVIAGYKQVAWFPGGIELWEAAGFPLRGVAPVRY